MEQSNGSLLNSLSSDAPGGVDNTTSNKSQITLQSAVKEAKKEEVKKNSNIDLIKENLLLQGVDEDEKQKVLRSYDVGRPIYYKVVSNQSEISELRERFDEIIIGDNAVLVIAPFTHIRTFDGMLQPVEKAIGRNKDFLLHMFKFNRTHKGMGAILNKGKYEVLDQYSVKTIFNHLNDIFYDYNEKGENYIGHRNSDLKMGYFPTNFEFQYATLEFVFDISIRKDVPKFIGSWCKKNLGIVASLEDELIPERDKRTLYRKLVEMGRYDYVRDIFMIERLNKSSDDKSKLVVADLFAGEGMWLDTYKKMGSYYDIYTIANEPEENRYLECKKKKFNSYFNYTYEELENVPEKSIDVMLFNPPYGVNASGERNVKVFLKSIIEDEYIHEGGVLIGAVNRKDFMECLDLLVMNFDIDVDTMFRMNGEEDDRLKQITFVGALRERKLDYNNYSCRREIDNQKNILKRALKKETTYHQINVLQRGYKIMRPNLRPHNISDKFDDLKIKLNPEKFISKMNGLWQDTMKSLKVESFSGMKIQLPDMPQTFGTVANLMSSGLLNGEIEGSNPHCLAAGITYNESLRQEGDEVISTKKSIPYCSVLTGGRVIKIADGMEESTVEIRAGAVVAI